jgi:negative regulator of flagellin synthesis FlgM
MKIGQSTDITIPVSQTTPPNAPKAGEEAAATAKSTASSAGVSVSVSNLARSLEKPDVSAPGDVDTAKVDKVKAAIQDGTYVVNPEAIADKLLANAQELLNRTTK